MDGRAPRVLVVDGGADPGLPAPFAGEGYEVRVVEAGQARAAMAEFAPDVLVIDLRHSDPVLTVRNVTRRDESERSAQLRLLLDELAADGSVLEVGDLVVDLEHQVAHCQERQVALTSTELVLLAVLARDGGVVAKSDLLERVWGSAGVNPNLLEVHISSLRRKLEQLGPGLIRTVRGVGYGIGGGVRSAVHAAQRLPRVP